MTVAGAIWGGGIKCLCNPPLSPNHDSLRPTGGKILVMLLGCWKGFMLEWDKSTACYCLIPLDGDTATSLIGKVELIRGLTL